MIYVIILISLVHSEIQIGEWKHYTSHITPTDIVSNNNLVYISTSGGILEFNIDSSELKVINNDPLSNSDINTMALDSIGNLIIGSNYPSGNIQIYNNDTGIKDKFIDEEVNEIIKICIKYPYMFVAYRFNESFGVLKFIYNDLDIPQYVDFYNNFPFNLDNISDMDIFEDKIYITTLQGILLGDFIHDNLKNYQNWDLLSIPFEYPTHLLNIDSKLIIGGYDNLWIYTDGIWVTINLEMEDINNTLDYEIVDIQNMEDNRFGVLTKTKFYYLEIDNLENIEANFSIPINTEFNSFDFNDNLIFIGLKHHGLLILDRLSFEYNIYSPNTSIYNQYDAITVLHDGRLLGVCNATIYNQYDIIIDRIVGISIFDNDNIINYIPAVSTMFGNYPFSNSTGFNGVEIDNYYPGEKDSWSVQEINNQSVLFSNSGIIPNLDQDKGGAIEFELFTEKISIYDTTDYVLDGMTGIYKEDWDKSYIVTRQTRKDPDGNIWIINPFSETYNLLAAVKLTNNDWIHIPASDVTSYSPQEVAFDNNGLAWFSFRESSDYYNNFTYSDGGIKVLDTKKTYNDPYDDAWIDIINLSEISGIDVWSISIDKKNRLWVLTSNGIQGYLYQYYSDGLILQPLYKDINENIINYLGFLSFNSMDHIRVDEQDNIWLTTRDHGVWLIRENVPPWAEIIDANDCDNDNIYNEKIIKFTTESSSILSDKVYDIAFDKNGKVYFATDKGISIVDLEYLIDDPEKINIKIAPNPLVISNNIPSKIYGIESGSTVKILKLSGQLVTELNSLNSPSVKWDGKNNNGEYIGSGIYLVVVSHPEKGNSVSKIAVIR